MAQIDGRKYFSFPSVQKLAASGVEERLRAEAFGYRAKYISEAAKMVLKTEGGEAALHGLRNRSYAEAKSFLLELPGVGPKVADCVCLMSLDKHDAIPVDTHVWQYAIRDYGFGAKGAKSITKKLYDDIGVLFRSLHGPYAGWAQSVLFLADLRQFKQEEPPELSGGANGKRKRKTGNDKSAGGGVGQVKKPREDE